MIIVIDFYIYLKARELVLGLRSLAVPRKLQAAIQSRHKRGGPYDQSLTADELV